MPEGRLQVDLVGRIVMAAWRARRADRLEAGVLGSYLEDADPDPRAALAAGLTRDNCGPGALATLVRYRGSVLAEIAPLRTDLGGRCREPGARSLAALKLLQAEVPGRRAAGRAWRQASPGEPNEPEKVRQNSMLAEDGAAELPVALRPGAAAPVPYGGLR